MQKTGQFSKLAVHQRSKLTEQLTVDPDDSFHHNAADEIQAKFDLIDHTWFARAGNRGLPHLLDTSQNPATGAILFARRQIQAIALINQPGDIPQFYQEVLAFGLGRMGSQHQINVDFAQQLEDILPTPTLICQGINGRR